MERRAAMASRKGVEPDIFVVVELWRWCLVVIVVVVVVRGDCDDLMKGEIEEMEGPIYRERLEGRVLNSGANLNARVDEAIVSE